MLGHVVCELTTGEITKQWNELLAWKYLSAFTTSRWLIKLQQTLVFYNFLQSGIYTSTCVAAILGDRKCSSKIASLSINVGPTSLVYTNLEPCFYNWYKFIWTYLICLKNKLVKIPIFHNYFFLAKWCLDRHLCGYDWRR